MRDVNKVNFGLFSRQSRLRLVFYSAFPPFCIPILNFNDVSDVTLEKRDSHE